MDFTNFTKDIQDAITKNANDIIDSFANFLTGKIEIEDIQSYIKEFKDEYFNNIKMPKRAYKKKEKVSKEDLPTENKEKTKRKLSIYNIFVSKHRHVFQENKETNSGKKFMSVISQYWRESDEGKFFAIENPKIQKQYPEKSIEEIYNIIEDMWKNKTTNDADEDMPFVYPENVEEKKEKPKGMPEEKKKTTKKEKKPLSKEDLMEKATKEYNKKYTKKPKEVPVPKKESSVENSDEEEVHVKTPTREEKSDIKSDKEKSDIESNDESVDDSVNESDTESDNGEIFIDDDIY